MNIVCNCITIYHILLHIEKRNIIPKKTKDIENVYYDKQQSLNTKRSSKLTETKLYKCTYEDCGKHFHDKGSFRKHQLTHGEKLFICKNCGKKFLDKSKLKRHSLVHSGVKQYKCNICQKMFSLDFNLRTHQRIHTGEKPYACMHPGCFKRFSQSSNLSAHEKTHEISKNNCNYSLNVDGWNCNGYYVNHNPVFSYNPLKNVIDNKYSSSLNVKNLININKLYDMLRKGIELQNQFVNNSSNSNNMYMSNECNNNMTFQEQFDNVSRCKSNIFINNNNKLQSNYNNTQMIGNQQVNKGKLFVTTKGKPIFDIHKGYDDNGKYNGVYNATSVINGSQLNMYHNVPIQHNEGYNNIENGHYGYDVQNAQIKKEDYMYNDNHEDNNGYIYNPDGIEEYKEYEYFPYSLAEFDNFK